MKLSSELTFENLYDNGAGFTSECIGQKFSKVSYIGICILQIE